MVHFLVRRYHLIGEVEGGVTADKLSSVRNQAEHLHPRASWSSMSGPRLDLQSRGNGLAQGRCGVPAFSVPTTSRLENRIYGTWDEA